MFASFLNNKSQVSSSPKSVLTYDFAASQIWSRLSLNDRGQLGRVSTLFRPNLSNSAICNEATKLSQYVMNHDGYHVKKMLDNNPALLSITLPEVMYGTHQLMKNVTALQVALRIKDLPMLTLLSSYFDQLPNGQDEKLNQLHQELPAGQFVDNIPFDFTEIRDAFDEVTFNHKDESVLFQALEKFHHDFAIYIKGNKYFNPQDLIAAFDHYNYRYYAWSENNKPIFWRQVINYVHSFMPPYYAEAFFQYFWNTTHNEPLSESTLKFKFGNEVILPLVNSDAALLDGHDHGGPDNSYWGFVVGYRVWEDYRQFVNDQNAALTGFLQEMRQLPVGLSLSL